ncbi:zinc ABC transporter substrate-binding protein [Amycolatopsis cihanbeyliensis]|uniref:Zinc transport system substrate-binding protein n=1 Tax=Amycolatopsis cihanbeyliensis TaxID=1128664 RepID=A0A542DEC7_AMYCI|nr:zinc ABC transporter substrate-binding protein [Amycolatopsis cihanbeyliensis]TQJ01412.1 zinc transport system substrate-binding protein [Amycolatopsis cihanbeyliensis]
MGLIARAERRARLLALTAGALLLAGCGSAGGDAEENAPAGRGEGPGVVAASAWEGAFARAAGATNVTVIVPPSIKHAPDYDPKPSDLAAVAEADYVLYAPFEGFAGKLKDAAGSSAELVELKLDNARDTMTAEIRRLAGMFGTEQAAESWIGGFETEYDRLSSEVRDAWREGKPPKVVHQAFLGFAAQLAGAEVLGTYGPGPVTARQLAELSAKEPEFVFDNEQMSTGTVLPGSSARQLGLSNYPGEDMELLSVYRTTAQRIIAALRG